MEIRKTSGLGPAVFCMLPHVFVDRDKNAAGLNSRLTDNWIR